MATAAAIAQLQHGLEQLQQALQKVQGGVEEEIKEEEAGDQFQGFEEEAGDQFQGLEAAAEDQAGDQFQGLEAGDQFQGLPMVWRSLQDEASQWNQDNWGKPVEPRQLRPKQRDSTRSRSPDRSNYALPFLDHKTEEHMSRHFNKVLRYETQKLGIERDTDGWVYVGDLLNAQGFWDYSLGMVKALARQSKNSRGCRFELHPDCSSDLVRYYIRSVPRPPDHPAMKQKRGSLPVRGRPGRSD